MLKFQYDTSDVEVRGDGTALVVAVVRGKVTRVDAQAIIAGAADWGAGRLAQVVRYDDAQVDLDAEELYEAALRACASDIPAALVVSEDYLSVFRKYAQMNADRGVMKAAFTRMAEAESWAVDQLRVRAHWARLDRALGSSP
jgi:hypothetical protein